MLRAFGMPLCACPFPSLRHTHRQTDGAATTEPVLDFLSLPSLFVCMWHAHQFNHVDVMYVPRRDTATHTIPSEKTAVRNDPARQSRPYFALGTLG